MLDTCRVWQPTFEEVEDEKVKDSDDDDDNDEKEKAKGDDKAEVEKGEDEEFEDSQSGILSKSEIAVMERNVQYTFRYSRDLEMQDLRKTIIEFF